MRRYCRLLTCAASKGISANLLKIGSKRRRTRQEIELDRAEEEAKESALQRKDEQIDDLQRRLLELEAAAHNNQVATSILQSFIERGEARQEPDGSVVIVRRDPLLDEDVNYEQ